MGRNERFVGILTTFFQEASVLIFVFGILDTYSTGKLTLHVGEAVGTLGFAFLLAAFSVRNMFYQYTRFRIKRWLSLSEEMSEKGGNAMNILGALAFIVVPVAAAVGAAFWKASKNISTEIKNRPVQLELPRMNHVSHDEPLVGIK